MKRMGNWCEGSEHGHFECCFVGKMRIFAIETWTAHQLYFNIETFQFGDHHLQVILMGWFQLLFEWQIDALCEALDKVGNRRIFQRVFIAHGAVVEVEDFVLLFQIFKVIQKTLRQLQITEATGWEIASKKHFKNIFESCWINLAVLEKSDELILLCWVGHLAGCVHFRFDFKEFCDNRAEKFVIFGKCQRSQTSKFCQGVSLPQRSKTIFHSRINVQPDCKTGICFVKGHQQFRNVRSIFHILLSNKMFNESVGLN